MGEATAMTKVSIRFAESTDAETIFDFINALAEYEREPDAVETTISTIRKQLDSTPAPFECLIAESKDGPRGFALFFTTIRPGEASKGFILKIYSFRNNIAVKASVNYYSLRWPKLPWNAIVRDLSGQFWIGINPLSTFTNHLEQQLCATGSRAELMTSTSAR